MLKRLAILSLLVGCGSAPCQELFDRVPDDARCLICVNAKSLNDASVVKKHSERLRALFADGLAAMLNVGVELSGVEKLWLTLGSNYPIGTAVIAVGKFDAVKFEQKMQQHVRDRRYAARGFRAEESDCFALETPVGLNPIPGLPASLFLAMKKDTVVIAFDQPTLQSLLRSPGGDRKVVRERFADCKSALESESAIVGALVPPESMTASSALLWGIKSVHLEVDVSDTFNARMLFRNGQRESFQSQLSAGLAQAKQLLAATRVHQTGEVRLAQFLMELIDASRIEADGNDLVVAAELKADVLARLLRK